MPLHLPCPYAPPPRCSEDRSFRLWDLSRGFVVRSVPCTKMPLCLTISRDGNTIVTGAPGLGQGCVWRRVAQAWRVA